ncbi:hypothetical protein Ddye_023497 [Dipteronia dyeriana]|uniref:Transposase n=1 Tax=Dipteronia dyeriana TaxID=168575 RepID=A0AAD9TTZ9_9ROSI|nr:hypothetical protein Ddye_023497 [Dipteronia dyeriana]
MVVVIPHLWSSSSFLTCRRRRRRHRPSPVVVVVIVPHLSSSSSLTCRRHRPSPVVVIVVIVVLTCHRPSPASDDLSLAFYHSLTVTDRQRQIANDRSPVTLRRRRRKSELLGWSSSVTSIAIILDPRYKMEFVMFVYERLYGAESKQLEEVKGKLFALFNEYVTSSTGRSTIRPSPQSYPSTSSGRQRVDDLDLVLLDFDNIINGDIVDIQRTQLDLYLEERRLERSIDLNILDFWKGNEPRYPELAAMARDVLSVPISTVASESAFSMGGRILDQFRSSLLPNVAEALVCSRDWILGNGGKCVKRVRVKRVTRVKPDPLLHDYLRKSSRINCKSLKIFDPVEFDKWVEKANAPAIESGLKLYGEVLGLRFKSRYLFNWVCKMKMNGDCFWKEEFRRCVRLDMEAEYLRYAYCFISWKVILRANVDSLRGFLIIIK